VAAAAAAAGGVEPPALDIARDVAVAVVVGPIPLGCRLLPPGSSGSLGKTSLQQEAEAAEETHLEPALGLLPLGGTAAAAAGMGQRVLQPRPPVPRARLGLRTEPPRRLWVAAAPSAIGGECCGCA